MVIPPMGPLPPPDPRDPLPRGELPESEREQDPARSEYVDELTDTPSRPLTDEEKEAAEQDPGRQERTYAPASERVPKEPLPGDEKVIHGRAEPVRADEGEPLR